MEKFILVEPDYKYNILFNIIYMNPAERFVIKRSLHKLIEENGINNDEIVRNALSHFDGSNNNEKISKILDFSENLVDNYSKELIESDKYKDIKLLFDKNLKKI